jgi:hypothetical protein
VKGGAATANGRDYNGQYDGHHNGGEYQTRSINGANGDNGAIGSVKGTYSVNVTGFNNSYNGYLNGSYNGEYKRGYDGPPEVSTMPPTDSNGAYNGTNGTNGPRGVSGEDMTSFWGEIHQLWAGKRGRLWTLWWVCGYGPHNVIMNYYQTLFLNLEPTGAQLGALITYFI